MNYKKMLLQLKKKPRVHGYISPNTEVKESPIHGLGLFAKKEIDKGEIVAVWGGCVAIKKEIEKFPEDIGYNYSLELYPNFYLAERKESELDSSDFINHSCSANCKNINTIIMITKRTIKKGEELTSDFSNKLTRGNNFLCNCGAKNCKKVIYFD